MKIDLRNIALHDLVDYEYWQGPKHKYHSFNGPYYRKSTQQEIEALIKLCKEVLNKGIDNPFTQKEDDSR